MKSFDAKFLYDSTELISHIERLAFNTWPVAVSVPLQRWIIRVSDGITKRANSVWTASGGSMPAGDWLSEVERFYGLHRLPVRYHISDASPKELDPLLEAHGFLKETPCSVLIAAAEEVIKHTRSEFEHALQLTVTPRHNDVWLSRFLEMEGFGEERRSFYHQLFTAIKPDKGFFTMELNGRCAAVGTSIVEDGWAGLINIAVSPDLRGQGIGRIILHELAVWSRNTGAEGIYLQVIDDNEPAMRLYRKAGFTPLYRYHYRYK